MEEIGMTRRKEDLPKQAGSHQGKTGTSMPPGHSGNADDAQPKTDRAASGFPIVGIGASAGGLVAFESFFSGMPADADPGMAFVLVQHLDPDHKSILTELIRRCTRMRVFEVEDGMTVAPNCAYIIPPGRDMAFLGGALHLFEPESPRGQRMPIDFFFRSLAQDQRERAICIVLSGAGSDGALGLRAIKGEGGMVMVQDPATTEYDGMPRSAIATGLVDFALPPAEMPAQLMAYVSHALGKPPLPAASPPLKTESALKKICVVLRAQTGHDFSLYKPSTLHRRIERRMAVHQVDALDGYVRFLQQTPAEVDALFRDLLIGVTSFFRDPEAFHALDKQVIARLLAGKPAGDTIRVWVPGCSSGEEAYSMAILLAEHQETLKRSFTAQVFATDIDARAIATARTGIYPASIAADVSVERLERFFAVEPGGGAYRIHKSIRDMLVISAQDVIKDPPFSKLDLISCRNLLIYMGPELQKKLIHLFHYALNPGGFLFLGTSETVGDFVDLFATLDPKAKIYQRKGAVFSDHRLPLGKFMPPMTEDDAGLPRPKGKAAGRARPTLRDLTEQSLLRETVPAAALVRANGDILYLHGRTGLFLEPSPGEASLNILKMAREGLKRDLNSALHAAVSGAKPIRRPGLRVKTNGDFAFINLTVRPVAHGPAESPEAPLYLVILEHAAAVAPTPAPHAGALTEAGDATDAATDADTRIAALQQELWAKEEYLQTVNEELETSKEELQSANQEMQSILEELRASNEELETSKEELQTVNENLFTVNTELQKKVSDLSLANNDMNNLLAGTGIATIFVDLQLRIRFFTPTATRIINLIQGDIGRPVGHIVSNLKDYDGLVADTRMVLDTLIPKALEVRTAVGTWFSMRIQPYRTLENVIEGAVITFVDITERKRAEEEILHMNFIFSEGQKIGHVGTFEYIAETKTTVWSDEECRIYGLSPGTPSPDFDDMLKNFIHPDDAALLHEVFMKAMETNSNFEMEHRIIRPDGSTRIVYDLAYPYFDKNGVLIRYVGSTLDITERKRAEEAIHAERVLLQSVINGAGRAHLVYLDRDFNFVRVNETYAATCGYRPDEMVGKNHFVLYPHAGNEAIFRRVRDTGRPFEIRDKPFDFPDQPERGTTYWDWTLTPVLDADSQVTGLIFSLFETSERKRAEEALRESEHLLREILANFPKAYISVIEPDLTIGFTTGQEFKKQGLDPQAFTGRPLEKVFGEQTPLVREYYLRAFNGEEVEFELFINNQRQLYRVVPLRDSHGRITRLLAVVENVTDWPPEKGKGGTS